MKESRRFGSVKKHHHHGRFITEYPWEAQNAGESGLFKCPLPVPAEGEEVVIADAQESRVSRSPQKRNGRSARSIGKSIDLPLATPSWVYIISQSMTSPIA
jgi:hypothetical protein